MDGHDADGPADLRGDDLRVGFFPVHQEAGKVVAVEGDPVLEVIHEGLDIRHFVVVGVRVIVPQFPKEGLREIRQGIVGVFFLPGLQPHPFSKEAVDGQAAVGSAFLAWLEDHRQLRDEPADGDRCLDGERIVGDDRNLFPDQGLGNGGAFLVGPRQDGDVAVVPFLLPVIGDGLEHEGNLLVAFPAEYGLDTAVLRRAFPCRLPYIFIYTRDGAVRISLPEVQLGCGEEKEAVVDVDHLGEGAPVVLQRFDGAVREMEIALDAPVEQLPVRAAPAVDGLLDVAHDKVVAFFGLALQQQREEVLPLDGGGVLEFVEEEMVVADAGLFIDKRGVAAVDDAAKEAVRILEVEDVPLLLQGGEFFPQLGGDAEVVELPLDGAGGAVDGIAGTEQGGQAPHGLADDALHVRGFLAGFLKEP